MRIVLFCATHRGYRFLAKLAELVPQHDVVVFTFREEVWEPPFFEDIHQFAKLHQMGFYEAKQVGSSRLNNFWETTDIDLMLAVSWRYMIPSRVYDKARLGTYVFHDSLLPTYRGFAPTVWAILNGEDHTGVSLFKMVDKVDEGDIVDQQRVPIGVDDYISDLLDRVTEVYLDVLERNLGNLMSGNPVLIPQDHTKATFTCKRMPDDNIIDWSQSTDEIYNLIRAVSYPYPGAYSHIAGEKVVIWSARKIECAPYVGRIPGRVVEIIPNTGSVVLTGDGALLVTQVQVGSGEQVCADQVLNRITITLNR